jgi:hypothetical protein
MSTTRQPAGSKRGLAAAILTADRIDYWIRPHVIQYCHGTDPSQSKFNPARDRGVFTANDFAFRRQRHMRFLLGFPGGFIMMRSQRT